MRSRIITLSLLLALLLAGCASAPPTFGDRVMADGQARVDIAQQWEQGSAAATRGEEQVKQGRRLLEKGRAELREGEAWIAAGNAAVQNSRQAYRSLSQIGEANMSAREAARRNDKLDRLVGQWREGETRIKQGRERVERGNARIEKGEAQLRTGQQLIDRGRSQMQAAQERYQQQTQS